MGPHLSNKPHLPNNEESDKIMKERQQHTKFELSSNLSNNLGLS